MVPIFSIEFTVHTLQVSVSVVRTTYSISITGIRNIVHQRGVPKTLIFKVPVMMVVLRD